MFSRDYSITVTVRGGDPDTAQKIYNSLSLCKSCSFCPAEAVFSGLAEATKTTNVIGVSLDIKNEVPIDLQLKYGKQKGE